MTASERRSALEVLQQPDEDEKPKRGAWKRYLDNLASDEEEKPRSVAYERLLDRLASQLENLSHQDANNFQDDELYKVPKIDYLLW